MSPQVKQSEAPAPNPATEKWPGPDSAEVAAYRREQERLARDHLGWVALIHGDEVVGVFRTFTEAFEEGFRRFGLFHYLAYKITDPNEPPEFIPWLYWV